MEKVLQPLYIIDILFLAGFNKCYSGGYYTKTLKIQWCKHSQTSTKFGPYSLYFPTQFSTILGIACAGVAIESFTDTGSETQRGASRYGFKDLTTSYVTVQQYGSQYVIAVGF